jgi:hypothetical protein
MNIAMGEAHGGSAIYKLEVSVTTLNSEALHRCPNAASQFVQVMVSKPSRRVIRIAPEMR